MFDEYTMENEWLDRMGIRREPRDSRFVDPRRTRTKHEAPYSYDEFFLFGSRKVIEQKDVHANYSDRLHQWWCEKLGHDAFDKLWMKHVGTRYEMAGAGALSTFLTEYHRQLWPEKYADKTIQVVALAEGCNPSTGYPYWIIWHREK